MDREKLFAELVRDEDERLKPYWDCRHTEAVVCPKCVALGKERPGLLTIGVGRNLTDTGIRKTESVFLALNDMEDAEAWLDTKLPWWRKLDEVRQRVLANMCFNMGINRLLKFAHMLAATQAEQWDTAVAEMKSTPWAAQVGPRAVRLMSAMATGIMPLLLLLASCTKEVKKDAHFDVTEQVQGTKATETEMAKTVEQASSTLDVKTTHEEDAVVVQEPDGTVQIAKVTARAPLVLKKGAKVVGTVPLSKTTTDSDHHVGAKTTTENETGKTAATMDKSKKSILDAGEETDTDVGFGWKVYVAGLLALVILLAAGYVYLKFVKKVVWL